MFSAWRDFQAALSFLTVIPARFPPDRQPGWAFTYFPLIGGVIGLALMLVLALPLAAEWNAFAALLIWVMLTGGLHLDGFADCCDGLLATTTPQRRLEIMKDPRTGAWAVIGLIMLLLGKWLALQSIAPLEALLPPVIGRWAMTLAASHFQSAQPGGLSAYFRAGLGRAQVSAATLICALLTGGVALISGLQVALLLPLGAGIAYGFGAWAARRLGGGVNGDVYGAICELTEWLCLIGLTMFSR